VASLNHVDVPLVLGQVLIDGDQEVNREKVNETKYVKVIGPLGLLRLLLDNVDIGYQPFRNSYLDGVSVRLLNFAPTLQPSIHPFF
jgi:hypothetical protein